ncbi:type IV pilus modification protein PilV [Amphritea spongicola]|nr:type IV pilus modification protein PilV [Aliamphritea spongicola]
MMFDSGGYWSSEKGSSLIEVLIAVVIISIGLLAVAGLQAVALKSNNGSYLRSQATFLAYDLADRMRAAPDSAVNGDYDDAQGGDRAQWDAQVLNLLGPGATGSVARNNRQVTITVRWNNSRDRIRAANDVNQATFDSFTYQVEF